MLTNNALANGVDMNVVQAKVTDANGNPVSGQKVVFTSGANVTVTIVTGTTRADGLASATLTSAIAGTYPVSVTQSDTGSAQLKNVTPLTINATFMSDASTADITRDDITANNALANGADMNVIQARVTDTDGNPVAGEKVVFTSDANVAVSTLNATTGATGFATAALTSTEAKSHSVTAALDNGSTASVNAIFRADMSTAHLVRESLSSSGVAFANGVDAVTLEIKVLDAQKNAIEGMAVNFITTDDQMKMTPASGVSSVDGVVKTELTTTVATFTVISGTLNQSSSEVVVANTFFRADPATAMIAPGGFRITSDGALADGSALNNMEVMVTDAHGNRVDGQVVYFVVNSSDVHIVGGGGTAKLRGTVS